VLLSPAVEVCFAAVDVLALVPLEDVVPVFDAAVCPPADEELVLPLDDVDVSFEEETVEVPAAELPPAVVELVVCELVVEEAAVVEAFVVESVAGVFVLVAALVVSGRPSPPSEDTLVAESDSEATASLVEVVETSPAAAFSGDVVVSFFDAESVVVAVVADAGLKVAVASEVA